MSNCIQPPVCDPCNPTYTEVGCCDYPPTKCVIYDGDDIPCLGIIKNENLNVVLQHLKDTVCALSPTGYSEFDFGCFASENITTEQEFVEFICSVLCEVLGSQIPGGITSLSSLNSLILSLTTQLNLVKNQSVISCFQTVSGLSATENISDLLTAVQTILCDHEDRLVALETGSVNTPLTAVDGDTIDFTTSGTNNHTVTAEVILDPDGDNAMTASAAGVMCISPDITVVDTSSINFSASGTKDHTITGSVKISAVAGNAASILGDGVYVADASTSETSITAVDSTSIDFTTSGTNDHTITADVILNPSILNLIQSTPTGLLVSSSSVQDPISPIDSTTVDLTVSGAGSHTIKADVIVSPASGNLLQALSSGLYVDPNIASLAGWLLDGNSNATSLSFLGTTVNIPLVFKVNSVLSGKVSSTGQTSFGYQSALSNSSLDTTSFGYQSLYNNTTGDANSAFGERSLYSNTIGTQNIAFGSRALYTNVNGDQNSAFGINALEISIGNYNSAFGINSLSVCESEENTAIGNFSGTGVMTLTGSKNTFLGMNTQYTIAGLTRSTAIGYNAIVSASNNMVLGGTGADKVSVVIGATTAVASAVLQATSTTQGFLPPKMTAVQAEAIAAPAEGLLVYATDGTGVTILSKGWWGYSGATWEKLN